MDPLIDWAYYKNHMEIEDDAMQSVFEPRIAAASEMIRRYCKKDFTIEDYQEETYDGNGMDTLFLRHTPVISVTELKCGDTEIPAEQYRLDKRTGRMVLYSDAWSLRIPWSGVFPEGIQNISVSYQAGYATIPADLKNACADLTTFIYDRGRTVGITSKSTGKTTTQYSAEIPSFLRAALNRHVKVGIKAI